jgi:pimeloyl-ACP methyl ester carboxylesterase
MESRRHDAVLQLQSAGREGLGRLAPGLLAARAGNWRLAAYHALGAFSETDFRDDLKKITVPALVVHGSDDQIVPLELSAMLTAKLIPQAKLVVYDGGSHGLLHVDKDRLNADLLAFLRN